jgi:osmoprotectant transport system permease protein
MRFEGPSSLASGPVIPPFTQPDPCVSNVKSLFCWSWVSNYWSSQMQTRLFEHIELTLIALAAGMVIAFAAALFALRHGWFEQGFTGLSSLLYTIPALALFELIVPVTGLGVLTIETGLIGYTLLVLFRNTLEGLRTTPPEVVSAATGMGMTPRQILWRVKVPLAIPSVLAGLRVATVTTISLATVAAYITPFGLGQPIISAIQDSFNTELIAAGGLGILLALFADGLMVLVQRAAPPWVRAARR